jgi:hypothetical protein
MLILNSIKIFHNKHRKIITILLFFTLSFLPFSANAQSVKAQKADSFIESIGVNTHLFYDDTVYHQKYEEIIKPKLLELGVRHIRDSGTRNSNGYLDRLEELKSYGISSTLIFGPNTGTPADGIELIKDLKGVVEAVEGPNELNLDKTINNWIPVVQNYVKELFTLVKADEYTKNLSVIGPSLTNREATQSVGDLSSFVDYGNIHKYYGNRHPETNGWGSYWEGTKYGSLAYSIKNVSNYAGNKPVIATESCYHNAINSDKGTPSIPENVAAKYIPRLFLFHFNQNVHRTLCYELIDLYQDKELDENKKNFGLLRNNGTEKPAFTALKNIINLLEDPGAKFQTEELSFYLKNNIDNVYQTLLQKRNGTFYLILWQGVSSFEPLTQKEIKIPPKKIDLYLKTPVSSVDVYTLSNFYKQPTSKYNPQKMIRLNVTDSPVIIKLTKAS